MRTTARLLACLALWSATAHAEAAIGLFSGPDCSSCSLQIPPSAGTGTFYISAVGVPGDPDLCSGFLGAEFRIVGLPAGWIATATPTPQAAVVIGNPLGAGTNIAFTSGQHGECFRLFTVTVTPVPPGSSAILRVAQHSIPSNPYYPCPRLVPDCFENFGTCVNGGSLRINSGDCSVGVAAHTWGHVKGLYN